MNNQLKNKIKQLFQKSKRTLMLIALTFLFVVYLTLTKTEPELVIIPEKVWPVTAIQAEYKDVTPNLELFGEITSARRSELRVSVGGRVVEVGNNFKEGGVVKKGELLLIIDDFEYQNAVIEEQAKYEILNRDFERAEELYLKNSISEQFKDNAMLEKTQQEITLAEAQKDLRDTKLFAPYDGVINSVEASLGKQVSTFNDKVGEVIDIKNLEVRFSLSKAQYGRLLEDDQAVIGRAVAIHWTAGNKIFDFEAVISRTGAEIKSNTGGIDIFATLFFDESEFSLIRPGAFVRLSVTDKTYNQVISVPNTAVYDDEYIFIILNDRLVKRLVVVMGYDGTNTLIKADSTNEIKVGDLIMVNQLREAGEGVKVDIL
jgi:RND family efflux transporter MFP subunit